MSQNGDQRTDFLPMEKEVNRYGCGRSEKAQNPRGGEQEAETAGSRPEPR